MHNILNFLGFTSTHNAIWNSVGYIAFVIIIVGVFSERYRNLFITTGAFVLAVYAKVFLHNALFTVLQSLIVVSGILNWTKIQKKFSVGIMLCITVVAYIFLIVGNHITNVWALIGSVGLLGIAFGLIILPKSLGFIFMAVAGALLVIYAFAVEAWVFFLLNIFFAFANIQTLFKVRNTKIAQ